MEQGQSLLAGPWRHQRLDSRPDFLRDAGSWTRNACGIEFFDERAQILGNRKALLVKFDSLTYVDSLGKRRAAKRNHFTV